MKHKYFDATGSEVSPSDALRDGVLRNGFTQRVGMTARDAATTGTRRARIITDGTSNPFGLNKPGWRVPDLADVAVQDRRRAVFDARVEYETRLVNAHKIGDGVQCSRCFGSGEINNEDCPECGGSGVLPEGTISTSKGEGGGYGSGNEGGYKGGSSDSHSLAQRMKARDQEYLNYDKWISDQWRG